MALLIECPKCRYRNSFLKKQCLKCELSLTKGFKKTYWIEYRIDGQRKRERIGPSKLAAETRLYEVKIQIAEGRYIDRNKNIGKTLEQLRQWYLSLEETQQKRSYTDIELALKNICSRLGDDLWIKDLTPSHIDKYKQTRLKERSYKGTFIKPATVNREITNLKSMLNKAIKYSQLDQNPIAGTPLLEENNVRDRVLSKAEFQRLLKACPDYLKSVVITAYYLPMRKSEILKLTWEEVDLKMRFIRLNGSRTKNKTGRVIPLHPKVKEMLLKQPRPIHGGRVFLKDGKPFDDCKKSYKRAVQNAELGDFTFHDLRHCAINNLRLAGNDHLAIRAASGHKTNSSFERYNLVTEEELQNMKWET